MKKFIAVVAGCAADLLSFAIARHKPKEKQTWQPPTKAELREHIRIAMQD